MAIIDTSNWKKYPITELFNLSLPSGDLQVKQVEDGEVPLITPSNYNNGLLQRISSKSESTKYKAKSITVDMFGNAYYQEEDFFVTAHGHVNVLIPKFNINLYVGLFISSAIKSMFMNKYSFSEMCTQKVLKRETISLPVDSNGNPDWKHMELYMCEVMEEAEKTIHHYTEANAFVETNIDELNRHMKTDFSIPLPVKKDDSIDWDYMDSYMKHIEEECLKNLQRLQEI